MTTREPDPTAEWLEGVRAEETPWRQDRPAGHLPPEPVVHEPARWRRTVGRVAPYLQAAAVAGWVASSVLDDDYDEGYDAGFDAGFDAGGQS